jgi:hypothetical protein
MAAFCVVEHFDVVEQIAMGATQWLAGEGGI